MPFESKAQAAYLFMHHPEVAKEFAAKTKSIRSLPDHVKKKRGGDNDNKGRPALPRIKDTS